MYDPKQDAWPHCTPVEEPVSEFVPKVHGPQVGVQGGDVEKQIPAAPAERLSSIGVEDDITHGDRDLGALETSMGLRRGPSDAIDKSSKSSLDLRDQNVDGFDVVACHPGVEPCSQENPIGEEFGAVI